MHSALTACCALWNNFSKLNPSCTAVKATTSCCNYTRTWWCDALLFGWRGLAADCAHLWVSLDLLQVLLQQDKGGGYHQAIHVGRRALGCKQDARKA